MSVNSKNAIRKLQEVEVWVRGEWKLTKAIVSKADLCKNIDCIRKIPSPRSNYRKGDNKGRRVKDGYCSLKCYESKKEICIT